MKIINQFRKLLKCKHRDIEITSMNDEHRRYLCLDCERIKIGKRLETLDEVAHRFGLSPHKIGDLEKATLSNSVKK